MKTASFNLPKKSLTQVSSPHPCSGRQKDIHYGIIRLLLILFLFAVVLLATAQEMPARHERQKVGVVLSGGGAKGVAHIGVLKALEEYAIPIDYIAGTSMGAIVGGMYAAGYSPDEIEELISSEEFMNASMGRVDKIYDYYYFHFDPTPGWLSISFRSDQNVSYQRALRDNLPTNIVSPGAMDFMFMQYLSPASAVAKNDFDSLFIPFRCIASDITNKKELVLRNGSLADAVRASMTFPLYFKPIMIDNRVVFDGGMYNNFPADVVMEDFKPDIIIGSVVAANPDPPSVHDIFSQLENMLMASSNYYLPEEYGVLLRPEVPDLAVTDFSRNKEVMEAGYNAVVENMHLIDTLVQDNRFRQEVQYNRWMFRQKFPGKNISQVRISGGDEQSARFANIFLVPEETPLTLEKFKENYYRLLWVNKYRHIYPRLHYNQDTGLYDVDLEVLKGNPWRREFGGNLSSRSINQFFAGVSYERLGEVPITLNTNVFLGNYYNSIKLGARFDFLYDYPFYAQGESTLSRWNYTTGSVYFFEEQKPSFIVQQELLQDFRIVSPLGYKGRVELGGFVSNTNDRFYNTTLFSRSDTPDLSELKSRGLYAAIERSTRDYIQYPTSGSFYRLTTKYIAANEKYNPGSTAFNDQTATNNHLWWEASLWWENFFLERDWFRWSFTGNFFYSSRPLLENFNATRIMAQQFNPFPLAHTRFIDSYRANHFVAGGSKMVFKLSRNGHLQVEGHAFHALKDIAPGANYTALYKQTPIKPAWSFASAFVYHTPAGPLSVNASYFHQENDPWAFIVNFGYILFNRKTY